MKTIAWIHRWLGVIACLAVLMFAGSGILHPVMSRMQPQPVHFAAPRVEQSAVSLSLRAVLDKNQIERFIAASLVQLPSTAAYRVQAETATHYFRADDGVEINEGEKQHAEFLARHFLGDNAAPITASTELKTFDDDYVFVNRLLPAWRIEFTRADGMYAYIDTAGNRLATLTDRNKRIFQIYFRTLHDFDFLENYPTLRVAIMLLLLGSAFSTAVIGIVMYVRLKRAAQRLKNLPARRWHRRLSLAIALVMFNFTISGTWHLLHSQGQAPTLAAPPTEFSTSELGDAALSNAFVLLHVNDNACYRQSVAEKPMEHHEHHHDAAMKSAAPVPVCLDAKTLNPLPDAETQRAEQLARYYAKSDSAVKSTELITKFSGEYGFINKRLPVWQVQFENDSTRWYVETASGALAMRADDADAREGWVFATFHKARFIVDPYKNLRDGFLIVSAAGMIVVALLGLWLFMRPYWKFRRN